MRSNREGTRGEGTQALGNYERGRVVNKIFLLALALVAILGASSYLLGASNRQRDAPNGTAPGDEFINDMSRTTTTLVVRPCETVSQIALDEIAARLRIAGSTLTSGAAVELPTRFSDSPPRMRYVVAAELQGPGYEGKGDIPVWISASLSERDVDGIIAGDGFAQSVSAWEPAGPDRSVVARKRDLIMTTPDPRQAEGCVRRR